MGFFKQGNKILLWGRVTRDASLRTTQTGKHVCGFGVKYDRHHNEDGQIVNEFIEVSAWGDLALYSGDDDVGLGKGDTVIVCGELIKDDYYREGEDKSKPKYKVNADLILDVTSFFQLLQMVVKDTGRSLEQETEKRPKKVRSSGAIAPSGFDDVSDEDDPFSSGDGELPF